MKKTLLPILLTCLVYACTTPAPPKEHLVCGFPEQKRMSISYERDEAEKAASQEAEKYYPHDIENRIKQGMGDKAQNNKAFEEATRIYSQKKDELKAAYVRQVCTKYSISEDCMDSISVESINKHWPSPF